MAILIFKQGLDSETGSLAYAEPIFHTPSNTLVISGSDSRTYRLALVDKINTGSIHTTGDFSGSNLLLDGNATIRGNITMGGSGLDFGDASDDNIVFKADISSSIIPDSNNSFNLGSDAQRWNDLYISGAISASGGHFDFDSDSFIDLNAASRFDVDAGGVLSLDSTNSITIGTAQDVPINIDATTFDVDASSTLTLDATRFNIGHVGDSPMDVEVSTLNIGASGYLHLSSSATLDVDASGAITINGESTTAISSSGALSIDSETGINIGTTTDKPIDIDASTFDVDASGALTIDSATSIGIGTNADKPIDIDSTTLDIDSSGAITINGESTTAISSSGALSIDSETSINIGTTSDKPVNIDSTTFDVDSTDGIRLKSNNGISLEESGVTVVSVDANQDVIFLREGGSKLDPDVEIVGYLKLGEHGGFIQGALSSSGEISSSADITTSGLNAGNINVGITGDNEIDTDSGNLTIDSDGGTVTIDDNTIITGDLTVNGTRTFTNTATLDVADNIININYGGSSVLAGLYANDVTAPNVLSGSILWNGTTDRWIAGQSGSEQTLLLNNGDSIISGSGVNNQITTFTGTHGVDSSANLTFDGSTLRVTGTQEITSHLSGSASASFADLIITDDASIASLTVTDLTNDRVVIAGGGGEIEDSANLTFDNTTLGVTGNITVSASGSFKDVKVTDNVTVDGVVRAERLNVTSSENILATFQSTDAAAKIVLKDVDGEGARFSYIGSTDTVGIGQSNTHNEMAIHINNNEQVAIGKNHTIPHAVLDVSGSLIVSGTLETTGDFAGVSGSFKALKVTDLGDNDVVFVGPNGELEGDGNLRWNGLGLAVTGEISSTTSGSFADLSVSDDASIASLTVTDLTSGSVVFVGGGGELLTNYNDLTWNGTTLGVTGSVSATVTGSFGRVIGSIGSTNGVVSGSSQVDYSALSGINNNIVSASTDTNQVDMIINDGSISANLKGNVISGSAQITALGFVSSSIGDTLQQVTTAGASTDVATTFSNTTDSTSKTTGALIVGGGVGINNTLNVGGDVIAFASSDKRLKDNIKPIEGALDKVSKISGNTFDWNEEKQNTYKGKDYGVIAQEIKDVMPELVDTRDNGYLAVKYDKIVPLLIESIKELKKEIEELKSK